MKNSQYWEDRIANNTWTVYNSLEEKNKALMDMYQEATLDIQNELYTIAQKINGGKSVTLSDMHKYNRLNSLQSNIEKRIEQLGEDTEKFGKENMKEGFKEVYSNARQELGETSFSIPNERLMEQMMNTPWQGSNFSKRLWKNTGVLARNLNEILTIGLTQGKTITEMAIQLSNRMNQSFNAAHKLIRTETIHYLNESAFKAYQDGGCEEVQVWAAKDERTCDVCGKKHGKKYKIDKRPVLPFHPNCRCTYLPVVGTHLNDGDNNDIIKDEKEIQKYKENVLKNNKSLNSTDQKAFSKYLDNFDKDTLNLYSNLSEHFTNNKYYGGDGIYSPSRKRIEMDLRSNMFEKVTGKNEGAFQTKFHEEFHQLDHLLAKTEFAKDDNGKIQAYNTDSFTNTDTKIGYDMFDAIDTDVLNLVNKAIDWKSEKEGKKIRKLKGLERVSRDARYSTIAYLQEFYGDKATKARISTLTDSIGLVTDGKICPYDFGFWGHKEKYNKERGRDGATSETWANFGSMMLRQDEEELKLMNELMPNTIKVYTEVFQQVKEYAKSNKLSY